MYCGNELIGFGMVPTLRYTRPIRCGGCEPALSIAAVALSIHELHLFREGLQVRHTARGGLTIG